jgi:hypothetical protein
MELREQLILEVEVEVQNVAAAAQALVEQAGLA